MQRVYRWRSTANTINTVQNLFGAKETENNCSQVEKEIIKFFVGGWGGAGLKNRIVLVTSTDIWDTSIIVTKNLLCNLSNL